MQDYGSQGLLSGDDAKTPTPAGVSVSASPATYQKGAIQESNDFDKTEDERFQDDLTILLTRTKKLIVPFFLGVGLTCLIFAILGIVSVWTDGSNIAIMLTLIFVSAMLGAYGIYKWGTVEMEIKRLGGENTRYESEITLLRSNKDALAQNVNGLNNTIADMRKDTSELQKAMHEFDDLRLQLKDRASENEDILQIVNGLNNVYDEMRRLIIDNQRSYLYEVYYSYELKRDRSQGLSKSEYDRALASLDEETRNQLNQIGTFEEIAGKDGTMTFDEFQTLVSKCLDSFADDMVRRESSKSFQANRQ